MAQKKRYNKIKITVVDGYEEMSRIAAEIILKKIRKAKKTNVLLPSGSTPKGVYKILREKQWVFRKARFFNFDEYCTDNKKGLISPKSPVSFRRFMKEHLFRGNKAESYFPSFSNAKKSGTYDKEIENLGGIDLCIDAMGRDGHTFGFNFPGTHFGSITRLVKINRQTRKVNEGETGHETPRYAISTGIKTGMMSKEIIFLVSGRQKAGILRKVIYAKKPTAKIPATVLRLHKNCRWIADKDAASEL